MSCADATATPAAPLRHLLGIYEKALPRALDWPARLAAARDAGYDFVEISIDETPERLARLNWPLADRLALFRASREAGVPVPSMCLSAHRKTPFGSADATVRAAALELMKRAIDFALDTGIRVIQLAGYDVYYERPTRESRQHFVEGLRRALELASRHQVMLAVEIMDTPFLNSIGKYLALQRELDSPWFRVYPDLGNLSAWGNDVDAELRAGAAHIVGVHVKETRAVGPGFAGQFRDLAFGAGEVDFVGCFRTLREIGYTGPLLQEMWTETAPDPLRAVREARDWVLERAREGGMQ